MLRAEAEYAAILADAYPVLGRIHTARADYGSAVSALSWPRPRRPDSPDVLVSLAVAYFYAEQYQKAEEPLVRALARDPKNAGALHMLGKTHFMTGDFERAARELEAALGAAPNDYDVAYTLAPRLSPARRSPPKRNGFSTAWPKRLATARRCGCSPGAPIARPGFSPKQSSSSNAPLPSTRARRARTTISASPTCAGTGRRDLAKAVKELQAELAAHPEEFAANYYLGVLHTSQGKWEAGLRLLEKSSRLQPENPDPHFFLGQAYQSLGKYAQAIEALRKSIALNPHLEHNDYQVTNAHFRLGQSLLKAGFIAEGEKELETAADLKSKAFKLDGKKLDAYLNDANNAVEVAANAPDNAAGALNNASNVANALDNNNKPTSSLSAHGIVAGPDALNARTREALTAEAAFLEKVDRRGSQQHRPAAGRATGLWRRRRTLQDRSEMEPPARRARLQSGSGPLQV